LRPGGGAKKKVKGVKVSAHELIQYAGRKNAPLTASLTHQSESAWAKWR
jgi:hypothetical protein